MVAFAALSDEDRTARLSVLADAERMAPSGIAFANNMVSFLKLVAGIKAITPVFVESFLVDRLAGMMNKNLVELTGARCVWIFG